MTKKFRFCFENSSIGTTYCIKQINELINRGYNGYFSLEPFADEIWNYSKPSAVIKKTMDFIIDNINSK